MDPKSDVTLVVRRTIQAPRSRVFDAWTTPDLMRHWFCPNETFSVAIADVDLKVGGSFRIGMRRPDNDVRIASGIYREIRRPEKLVFTWSWEHDPMDTLVTVTFHSVGEDTEVVLKHELLPTKAQRDDHEHGWNGCLQHLAGYLQSS